MLIDEAGAKRIQSYDKVATYREHIEYHFDVTKYKETVTYDYNIPFSYMWRQLFLTDGSYTIAVNYDKSDKVLGYDEWPLGHISLSGPTGL